MMLWSHFEEKRNVFQLKIYMQARLLLNLSDNEYAIAQPKGDLPYVQSNVNVSLVIKTVNLNKRPDFSTIRSWFS